MENLKIRTAHPEDAEALLGIYEYYVLNTAITFEYDVPSADEFRSRIENTLRKYPYIVAEKNGGIVGYAYAGSFVGRAAYGYSAEVSIYVDKDFRHLGIGRILYEQLELILKEMNITNLIARVSNPETEDEYLTKNSVGFHKAIGYRLVGELYKCGFKFGRWYNSACMEKIISEHIENPEPVKPFGETEIFSRLDCKGE